MKNSGSKTTDQVAGKVHHAVDEAAKRAGNAEEYAREHASEADERVREVAAKGKEKADDAITRVHGYVSENPLISIGIAFVAGALYSSLRSRR